MGLYLGKEKINNLSVGYTTLGITNISDETTINISGILKGENNKIVPAIPGVDYAIPNNSTVTSVNGKTGDVTVSEIPSVTASDNGKIATVMNGVWSAKYPTSYSPFSGASASAAGAVGLVPSPKKGQQNRYLKGDGTWADVLPQVTTSDNGKFLRVVNGAWAVAEVDNASGVSF